MLIAYPGPPLLNLGFGRGGGRGVRLAAHLHRWAPTTRAVFEAYVEKMLAPSLYPGQVVVMDNPLSPQRRAGKGTHRGGGCELVYLPPYSPDFNPTEQAFSKLKGLLRKAGARTREALIEAIGAALSTINARDASGFFGHCGYRTAA